MSAEVIYTSDNRTVIRIGGGFNVFQQRVVFTTNGGTKEVYLAYPTPENIDIYIEDVGWRDYFVNPYSNSNIVTVEAKLQAGPNSAWVTLSTYSLTYEIRNNAFTRPTFTANYSLIDAFKTALIAGQSSVKASFSNISTKLGAGLRSCQFTVGSKSYGDPYQSDKLSGGTYALTATVTDTRGISASQSLGSIRVYDYQSPSIVSASGQNGIVIRRSESDGKPSDSGTHLFIAAKKKYAALDGSNKCELSYKIKQGASGGWGEEKPLLSKEAGDELANVVDGITLDTAHIYPVMLIARDDMSQSDSVTIMIPSESVFMERSGSNNSISFGGHVTESNAFEVYQNAYFKGDMYFDDLSDTENIKRYKLVIGSDGVLRAEELPTTFSLRRR